MNRNMSSTDRIVRLVAGAVLVAAAIVVGIGSPGGVVLAVVGAVMLATSAVGFCPLYRLFGLATRH